MSSANRLHYTGDDFMEMALFHARTKCHNILTRFLLLILFAGVTIGFQGCGKAPLEPQETAHTSYDPNSDPLVNFSTLFEPAPEDRNLIETQDVLYLNLNGSPQNLNPLFGSSTYEFMVSGEIFDGPFSFDKKMEWKVNPTWVDSYEEAADHLS